MCLCRRYTEIDPHPTAWTRTPQHGHPPTHRMDLFPHIMGPYPIALTCTPQHGPRHSMTYTPQHCLPAMNSLHNTEHNHNNTPCPTLMNLSPSEMDQPHSTLQQQTYSTAMAPPQSDGPVLQRLTLPTVWTHTLLQVVLLFCTELSLVAFLCGCRHGRQELAPEPERAEGLASHWRLWHQFTVKQEKNTELSSLLLFWEAVRESTLLCGGLIEQISEVLSLSGWIIHAAKSKIMYFHLGARGWGRAWSPALPHCSSKPQGRQRVRHQQN